MSRDYCRGCGVVIQTVDSSKPGYVPEDVLQQKGQLICKRCYRMTHYGEAGTIQPDPQRIRENIRKAVSLSDLLVVVVDFADLTGTLPVWAGFVADKPYLLIINKSDLLPSRTKPLEICEYFKEYLKCNGWATPRDLIMTSGLKGGGVEILAKRLTKEAASGDKIGIFGVTNVGKSSLIKRLLTLEGSHTAPTVSKFPGTTMGLSNWSVFKGRNTLIDTPGLVAEDRVGDLLCPECASKLVSGENLQQKLWGLKPGKGVILGGLFGVEFLGEEETVLIAFNSPEMITHRTDNTKLFELLTEGPSWLLKVCQGCKKKIKWQHELIQIQDHQDLSIAGLGWISHRGPTAEFKFWLPKGVRWEIRPALIGKR